MNVYKCKLHHRLDICHRPRHMALDSLIPQLSSSFSFFVSQNECLSLLPKLKFVVQDGHRKKKKKKSVLSIRFQLTFPTKLYVLVTENANNLFMPVP